MAIINTTLTAYQYAAAISITLWTRLVFETDRLSLRYQNVRKEFTRSLQLNWASYGNKLVTLFLSLDLKQDSMKDFEINLERARGSYTNPLIDTFNKNSGLEGSLGVLKSTGINRIWTKVMRESFKISETQEVHTIPFRWQKGLEVDKSLESELFRKLGVTQAKRGLENRRKILGSLLDVFTSCIAHTSIDKPLVGILFPASTSGSHKYKESFCSGASYSAKSVSTILKTLAKGSWIQQHPGFRGQGHHSGVTTLWIPTEKLKNYLVEMTDGLRIVSYRNVVENIDLKDARTDDVVPTDKRLVKEMSQQVGLIQKLLQSSLWTYMDGNQMRVISPEDLELTRIFKYDYQSGGRLYCNSQNLPKLTRQTLQINGRATVELDFKSLHPTMLYHLGKIEAPEDCYAVKNVNRDDAKLSLLVALNAKSRLSAKQAISRSLKIKYEEAEIIMTSCESVHKDIKHHFYTSAWRQLQYLDSSITVRVLTKLFKAKIPALPVHDSYIVEAKYEKTLRSAMTRAYQHYFGKFKCSIE